MIKLDRRILLLILYPGICLIMILVWYNLLYGPRLKEREALEGRIKAVQTEANELQEKSNKLSLVLKEKREITESYNQLVGGILRDTDIPSAMISIIKSGRGKNIRILSVRPDTSELFSGGNTGQLKTVKFEFELEGRYIDIGLYLIEISELPFFKGYENVHIEAVKELYPKTKANVVCSLLVL